MIYIISGASRSGKTLLAKRILKDKGVTYLSLDWLMMGFNTGIPEYGIHHLLFPDDIARRMWSFLKGMIESMIHVKEDCVIEGEAILPELITELVKEHPNHIKVCFLGYADVEVAKKVEEIKTFSNGEHDWLLKESDEYIIDHTKNMIDHSKMIQNSCRKYGFDYFDTSNDFESALKKATDSIIG